MNINIKATGIELTPSIREYLEKKIFAIEKFIDKDADVNVLAEVAKTTNHHKAGDIFKAEIKIIGGGFDKYAVSEKDDLYAAIDLVKDEIIHELKHEKGKNMKIARRQQSAIKDILKNLPQRFNYFKKKE
ncbi:MAG: ribosome-associated translation inhibitor RaiA [bacterium]|nr:ribosome-associated translation inhibitor RaiA [bacterium]